MSPSFGWFSRTLIRIAGADESLLARCPPRDLPYVYALAWLMLGSLVFQAAIFAMAAHVLFAAGGRVRVELIAAAIALAFFVMAIDRYSIIIPSWHREGMQQLRRGGLDIAGHRLTRIKANFVLALRILLLSVSLSVLSAISVSSIVFWDEISGRLQADYLAKNRTLIADVTSRVDDGIRLASDLTAQQSNRVSVLATQVQSLRQALIDPGSADRRVQTAEQDLRLLLERRGRAEDDLRAAETFAANEYAGIKGADGNTGRAGFGLRYKAAADKVAAAKARLRDIEKEIALVRTRVEDVRKQTSNTAEALLQRARDHLPAAEEALKSETAKLDAARQESDRRITGRDQAVRAGVEDSLGQIGRTSGLLAQVSALFEIAHENWRHAFVIALIDLLSFGLELAAVLAKVFGYVPTTFGTLLVQETYLADVRIAEEGLGELRAIERPGSDGSGGEPISDVPPPAPQSPEPPKRKRGRPRKHPSPGS